MTRYLAVTTCNAEQWQQFGRAMANTFKRHWPEDIPLQVYAEDFLADDWPQTSVDTWIDLYEAAPWLPTWKMLYRDPRYQGGPDRRDYRRDAVRFSHKIAALGAAIEMYDCDVLIWIDADVVTHSPVTMEWLADIFPEPAVVAWLDRERTYPECGFLMFRMPLGRKIIRDVVKMYRNGAIFRLPEWHDSFVIEHVVRHSGVPAHSLSGTQGRMNVGHPWIMSVLAAKMDHLKGESRKAAGRSVMGKETKAKRPEAYWHERQEG